MDQTQAEMSVTASSSDVERLVVATGFDFESLRQAFEEQLGCYDFDVGASLVEDKALWATVEAEINPMAGPHGLMLFFRIDQGEIASLRQRRLRSTLYLVGNPLIATEILAMYSRAGFLVPFRVHIFEDSDTGMIAYDRPSSFLKAGDHPELAQIGNGLDAKMEALIASLAAV